MAMNNKPGGILRTDYETDRTRLDDFPALESDWQELLRQLGKTGSTLCYFENDKEGSFAKLLQNQVLTVLVEIVQKKVSAYEDTYTDAPGTAGQVAYTENLRAKIDRWICRLEHFISGNWKAGNSESTATQAARLMKEQLEKSIPAKGETDKRAYYRMLRTVSYIQEHTGYYLDLIENSGDMDGALALLWVYVKNYARIAQEFNSRFASLPELYRKQVLHTCPGKAVQDNVYVVITPTRGTSGFTLPKGQSFPAGQNAVGESLVYQTTRAEQISPMYISEVNAVFLKRKEERVTGIYQQPINFTDSPIADTLFCESKSANPALGWMIESPMLLLGEGERKVSIGFRITTRSAIEWPSKTLLSSSFSILLSGEGGWIVQYGKCHITVSGGYQWLRFEFALNREGIVPTPCIAEIHGTATTHPAVRIQATNNPCPYGWASNVHFDTVQIRTEVSGIRNFIFYNELGEVDTTQPFYLFGPQAEKGAWFMFGNEEIGHKPLEEVRLRGLWKKLPETEADFSRRYKDYTTGTPIGADSFVIATEWQENYRWNPCLDGKQHLFVADRDESRSLEQAELIFDFPENQPLTLNAETLDPEPYEYDRDRDGFFRATLQGPSIGFGTEAYRALFAETMIHNSRCKEKKRKALPSEPVIPMLADAELSYIACEEAALARMENSSIILTRITPLSESDTFSIGKKEEPFIAPVPADHLLYFALLHSREEPTVRMYLDLVLPKEQIPFYNPQPDKRVKLTWEYWKDNKWSSLPATDNIVDETCGLTQSGFIELRWPEKRAALYQDKQGKVWLRASVTGDVSSCLAVGSIRTNCIRLTAQNGDGLPLPAGTIQGIQEADLRIESIAQPQNGFGGKPAETETGVAIRQSARIHNRHRAVTIKDYEQLVLEHFPEVDKVQCLLVPQEKGGTEIVLVVFSHTEDSRYYLSPVWKLAEIQRLIRRYVSPFVSLRVVNPVYERLYICCKAVLWDSVQDEAKVLRQLTVLAQNYIAPWLRKGEIPLLRQHFSYKELHARMVNHEDLMKLSTLEVNGRSLPYVDIDTDDFIISGSHPSHVLLPKIKIELLSPHDGIDEAEIEGNFIIR